MLAKWLYNYFVVMFGAGVANTTRKESPIKLTLKKDSFEFN